eukprot:CAMPEP_0114563618 /NCGR_PEP_ID=MMETSP0114-20121206/13216_1 /TAXON_ID=31324 /ORGANISM="Goniomonas sp, Strain m" /LENGTH=56 /DNA_ID=CAMNT_0001749497 /DNA_START=12 /DNA_END=182 /DNA_ORIENTATION=+
MFATIAMLFSPGSGPYDAQPQVAPGHGLFPNFGCSGDPLANGDGAVDCHTLRGVAY